MEKKVRPYKSFRAGSVQAAVWRNFREVESAEAEASDGQEVQEGQQPQGKKVRESFSIQFSRGYIDKATGKWANSDYLFPSDLGNLEILIRAIQTELVLKKQG